MAVVVEVGELVGPLCYYSERILDKGDDDEEATDRGEVAATQLSDVARVRAPRREDKTYGLRGSLRLSKRSSILLVCARMASSALDPSGVSSLDPPNGFWAPMP